MNPSLTNSGRCLLIVTGIVVAAAAIAGDWTLMLLGIGLIAVLAHAFFGMLPATLILERRLVGIILDPEVQRSGSLIAGRKVSIAVRVRNRGGVKLRRVIVTPHMSRGLVATQHVPAGFDLPSNHMLETDMEVTATETGRWAIHGFRISIRDLLGLFVVSEYIATTTVLKFLPAAAWSHKGELVAARMISHGRAGLHHIAQRGFGTELRELRDHQHGDPFRAIAWKATARTGRLMVKEYESELVLNTYICLDISSTMRGGYHHDPATPSKLEHGVRLAWALAQMTLSKGDRVGLITFDEKIHGHLRPRDGRSGLGPILQHLIGVQNVVDTDLTEYDDTDLTQLVARYLMVQERLDFRRRRTKKVRGVGQGLDYWKFSRDPVQPDGSQYDGELMRRWIESVLPEEIEMFDDPALTMGVVDYPRDNPLRRFAHLRGIEVPYRVETRLGQKERGLVQCLEEVLAATRDSHFIIVISDLCGVMNTDLVVRGLRLVQARRHKLAIVQPFTPSYVQRQNASKRGQVLHELFSAAEQEERGAIAGAIRRQGVPVLPIGPAANMAGIVRQLRF